MFNRTSLQAAAALVSISLVTGCGVFSDSESAGDQRLVVGTTSSPSTLDPAASWDNAWELFRNVFQTLVSFPTGSTTPQSDAADCKFTDTASRVFECKLIDGLTFSNGHKLDAKAVQYSIERIRTIDHKGGPNGMLGSLDKIETVGDRTVVFRLNKPDATFPFVLATPAMSIVDPADYPADRLRSKDGKVSGSGPYVLDAYTEGESAELTKNPTYKGFAHLKNGGDHQVLQGVRGDGRGAQEEGDRRHLPRPDRRGGRLLQDDKPENQGLQLVESTGTDIRYLVFNAQDPSVAKLPVRKAIAQLVDRDELVNRVYQGTAEPLYSMVPKGIAAHGTQFFDRFGTPSVEKAEKILREAGIDEPVKLTFWYTTDCYGSSTAAEFKELKRQLEESGLFQVTLQGKPWTEYQAAYQKGEYPVFGRGWFPDFPDPDNFVAPFVGKENVLGTPYLSPRITDQILPKSRRQSDRGTVTDEFVEAQEIMVKDVRLLPLWQGKLYIAAREDIGGGERALDPQTVMQMWELHRRASW